VGIGAQLMRSGRDQQGWGRPLRILRTSMRIGRGQCAAFHIRRQSLWRQLMRYSLRRSSGVAFLTLVWRVMS